VGLDHVTSDMSVAVYNSSVARIVPRKVASLAKPQFQRLAVGLKVL
jgi:hypothetical protein